MPKQDYTTAPYYAISGIGYGKGFTAEEADENYVQTQLRNFPARNTAFKTRPKWEAELRTGEARAGIWKAPEGTWGFFSDGRIFWKSGDESHPTITQATADELVRPWREPETTS